MWGETIPSFLFTGVGGSLGEIINRPPQADIIRGNRMDVKNRDYQRFIEHLKESADGVLAAARWLNHRGYSVNMPPITFGKNYEDRLNHVDGGDLFISLRVEVKTLSVTFTSKADWKFGDKFIVCAKHSFDFASPKPYGYIIQSSDLAHLAVVNSTTFKHWYVEKKKDSRYEDMTQEFYLCPIDLVKFYKV